MFDATANATPEIMLRNADMAMHAAKGRGKGRFVVYDESMHVGVFERLELKGDLARAVENNELLLYYQPIVSTAHPPHHRLRSAHALAPSTTAA